MCFMIDKKHKNAILAKKDVVCYKRFASKKAHPEIYAGLTDNILISPIKEYRYEMGETYVEDTMKPFGKTIFAGLHSYKSEVMALRHANSYGDEIVVACIIPKGAKYFYNSYDEEYVSDELKIGKLEGTNW